MRLIDADKLLEKTECLFKDLNSTEDYMGIGYNHGVGDSIAIVKNAPSIEAEPVKTGRWEMNPDPYGVFEEIPVCSICGHTNALREQYPYCPWCGANMDGQEKKHE